mmetsp:Transcript_6354/g.9781  ORF Transcript_6354/g.9781 Transcript_6354/m.9781 type:complete len:107 (-) Transcript_6354:17-337(-)
MLIVGTKCRLYLKEPFKSIKFAVKGDDIDAKQPQHLTRNDVHRENCIGLHLPPCSRTFKIRRDTSQFKAQATKSKEKLCLFVISEKCCIVRIFNLILMLCFYKAHL